MSFQNLKDATSNDIAFLELLFQHWHGSSHAELVECFVSFHNAVIATGYLKYSVHRGDVGKFTRAGLTYKVGKRAAMCFDIDAEGFKFLFYRGKDRQPYAGQKAVSYTQKDWSGFVYLTPTTIGNVCRCSEESSRLLIEKYDKGEIRITPEMDKPPIAPRSPSPFTPAANDLNERPSERMETKVSRILRDTAMSRKIKGIHDFRCQICGHRITLKDGSYYAEAHHIQPLGEPHNGPDVEENIICVCPNHHAELDYFACRLDLDRIKSIDGHRISQKYVDYHNQWHDKQ